METEDAGFRRAVSDRLGFGAYRLVRLLNPLQGPTRMPVRPFFNPHAGLGSLGTGLSFSVMWRSHLSFSLMSVWELQVIHF